jgi:hypothetical protein
VVPWRRVGGFSDHRPEPGRSFRGAALRRVIDY